MAKFEWQAHWLLPVAALVHPTFAADYLTVPEAQKILFPKADRFERQTVELTGEQLDLIKDQSGVRQRNRKPEVWRAFMNRDLLGLLVVDEVIGKHEFITYSTALSPDGKVLGVEILSYRETHGGEVRESEWRSKFKGKTLSDPFKLDNDIPNISGATLSCRNLTDGIKRILILQKVIGNG
jgi:Na+-translocating ferredoxin:NAD+ oxidoreductase RnfG subunit